MLLNPRLPDLSEYFVRYADKMELYVSDSQWISDSKAVPRAPSSDLPRHVTPGMMESRKFNNAMRQYVFSKPSYLEMRFSTEACEMRCEHNE